MADDLPNWTVKYYTDHRGKSDVHDYIRNLQKTERAQVYNIMRLLEDRGLTVGEPHVKRFTKRKPLCEMRPGSNRVIFFAYQGTRFVMLHAFRKKGNRTPPKEIDKARRLMHKFLERER